MMRSRLAPGGWLVDGTCDEGPADHDDRIDAEGPQWLTISCRLAGLEQPSQVAARLPQALITTTLPDTGSTTY